MGRLIGVVRVRRVLVHWNGRPAELLGEMHAAVMALVFAKNADDAALNLDVIGGHHYGRHFRIGGLQANLPRTFTIEALKGRVFAANQGNHDVTGVGDLRLLADNEVPVHDVILDHGSAFDLQYEGIAAAGKVAQRNRFAFFHRFQRAPRRDSADQREFLYLPIADLFLDGLGQLNNLNGAALIVAAANEAF